MILPPDTPGVAGVPGCGKLWLWLSGLSRGMLNDVTNRPGDWVVPLLPGLATKEWTIKKLRSDSVAASALLSSGWYWYEGNMCRLFPERWTSKNMCWLEMIPWLHSRVESWCQTWTTVEPSWNTSSKVDHTWYIVPSTLDCQVSPITSSSWDEPVVLVSVFHFFSRCIWTRIWYTGAKCTAWSTCIAGYHSLQQCPSFCSISAVALFTPVAFCVLTSTVTQVSKSQINSASSLPDGPLMDLVWMAHYFREDGKPNGSSLGQHDIWNKQIAPHPTGPIKADLRYLMTLNSSYILTGIADKCPIASGVQEVPFKTRPWWLSVSLAHCCVCSFWARWRVSRSRLQSPWRDDPLECSSSVEISFRRLLQTKSGGAATRSWLNACMKSSSEDVELSNTGPGMRFHCSMFM